MKRHVTDVKAIYAILNAYISPGSWRAVDTHQQSIVQKDKADSHYGPPAPSLAAADSTFGDAHPSPQKSHMYY